MNRDEIQAMKRARWFPVSVFRYNKIELISYSSHSILLVFPCLHASLSENPFSTGKQSSMEQNVYLGGKSGFNLSRVFNYFTV